MGRHTSFLSVGGAVVALLVMVLSQMAHTLAPPAAGDIPCATQPPLSISLPATLPDTSTTSGTGGVGPSFTATPGARLQPMPVSTSAPTTAAGTAGPGPAMPTPAAETPPIAIRSLFRADDPPAAHGLVITGGPLMPWVIPQPCRLTGEQRRGRPLACVNLLPPGRVLCISGASGSGRLSTAADAPLFAVQAERVTLRDSSGTLRLDVIQGYFRYDDPGLGLLLLCPRVSLVERIGSNARWFSASCSNRGADGWSVSGQVTDGGSAAPDSVGITIVAPDGSQFALVGALPVGGIHVDDLPDDTP